MTWKEGERGSHPDLLPAVLGSLISHVNNSMWLKETELERSLSSLGNVFICQLVKLSPFTYSNAN